MTTVKECLNEFEFTSAKIGKQKKIVLKNFDNVKVIVNKPTSKDYKINSKTLKILVLLHMLFFSVFRPLGLFTLCSHATKFCSLGTSALLC